MAASDSASSLKNNKSYYRQYCMALASRSALKNLLTEKTVPSSFTSYFSGFLDDEIMSEMAAWFDPKLGVLIGVGVDIKTKSENVEGEVKAKALLEGRHVNKALFLEYINELTLACCDSINTIEDKHDLNADPIHRFSILINQGEYQWSFETKANSVIDFNEANTVVMIGEYGVSKLSPEGKIVHESLLRAVNYLGLRSAMSFLESIDEEPQVEPIMAAIDNALINAAREFEVSKNKKNLEKNRSWIDIANDEQDQRFFDKYVHKQGRISSRYNKLAKHSPKVRRKLVAELKRSLKEGRRQG